MAIFAPLTLRHFHSVTKCKVVACDYDCHGFDEYDDCFVAEDEMLNMSYKVKDMNMYSWRKLLQEHVDFLFLLQRKVLVNLYSREWHLRYWWYVEEDLKNALSVCIKSDDEMKSDGAWVIASDILDIQTAAVLCIADRVVRTYRRTIELELPDYFKDLEYLTKWTEVNSN